MTTLALRHLKRITIGIISAGALLYITANIYTFHRAASHLYTLDTVPHADVAIILGARIYKDGRLSDILRDRADTAIDLYHQGKVQKFLVSGDHGTKQYDEVNAIRKYLLSQNIPPEIIFLDHAGFDTYDSMYRAKHIFDVQSLIIPTQDFHLTRAVYLAHSLGMTAYGIPADRHHYVKEKYNRVRESLARVKALLNTTLHSQPEYQGEKIPITGDARKTWDTQD